MALDHLAEVMDIIWPMSCLHLLSVRQTESTRDQSPSLGHWFKSSPVTGTKFTLNSNHSDKMLVRNSVL